MKIKVLEMAIKIGPLIQNSPHYKKETISLKLSDKHRTPPPSPNICILSVQLVHTQEELKNIHNLAFIGLFCIFLEATVALLHA